MGVMDALEVEESLFAASDAKLHGGMCRTLSTIVCKVLAIFPVLEATKPRSKSGIQALCSLHVALEKAKNLLQYCSYCSKLYLAITGDSVLLKFETAKCAIEESLRRIEDIVPRSIGYQVLEIATELEGIVFSLDPLEKQIGHEVIALLQLERKINSNSDDNTKPETFHQAALRLGITSSKAALAERRALKRLIERAQIEDDKRKESIVAYLLHLMRKYYKLFRSELSDDNGSQGMLVCSPTVKGSYEDGPGSYNWVLDRQPSKFSSFNFKPNCMKSGNMAIPPEEFRCPISLQLMYDPVIISSGQTYERICIEKWFLDGHSTCPKTQMQLSHPCLTPNYSVKSLIASWCEQNGVAIPSAPPDSLDFNFWRLGFSESESECVTLRSMETSWSCKVKEAKVVPLEESGVTEKLEENESPCHEGCDNEVMLERYDNLLTALNEGESLRTQCKVVEEIRFLLKDDDEARSFMGENGLVEALMRFLRLAINEKNEKDQEIGAMALFNLAVNNNRNKELILSSGVLPLLEEMIRRNAYESSVALYLNLSCLDKAQPSIGSSQAVPFLVRLLQAKCGMQCKLDALHTLLNLSSHPPNIPRLLSAGVVNGLQTLIMGTAEPASDRHTWAEKSIAVLTNLASSKEGKEEILSSPGLIAGLAAVLGTGEVNEQEQAISCLLLVCNVDEKSKQVVLQEGVIPALVSISVNGTARGKEKAQKLLMLFREQRQRNPSPIRLMQRVKSDRSRPESEQTKPSSLSESKSSKLGRSWTKMWKPKNLYLYNW